MKKYIKAIISIIFSIILVIALIWGAKIRKENKLITETNALNDMLVQATKADDFSASIGDLEGRLKTTVSTGNYAKVETAAKTYLSDLINSMKDIEAISDDKQLANILEVSNLKKDSPDFKDSTKYLNDTITKLDKLYEDFGNYFSKDHINGYIKDQNLNSYYTKLYERIMLEENGEEISLDKEKEEILSSIDKIRNIVKQEQKVINFLKDHKGKWTIQNGSVAFYSSSLVSEYNALITALQKI